MSMRDERKPLSSTDARLVERADRLIKLSWLERLPCPVLLHLRTVRCEPQPEGTLIPAMHERR
ncbi:MAG: hypothetical protein Q7T60_13070, partial [Sphingopyxis sp.]|nr:hypothetical protein [Sphingopyxis sp.]